MPDGARRGIPLRRTPCVGICSTTYGDLVCRGCKRFAHEIVGWNGYRDEQRDVVWERLNRLLAESVRAYVAVIDEDRLRTAASDRVPDAERLPAEVVAFRAMCVSPAPFEQLGLASRRQEGEQGEREEKRREVVRRIDAEFYARSRGYYEASFKTLT